jgi:hypothetical protein
MEARLINSLSLDNFQQPKQDLAFGDDLVIDIKNIFTKVVPKSDVANCAIQINLIQNEFPVSSPTNVRDGEYGNEFSNAIVYAVIPNENLDQLRRGFYQVMLQFTVGSLTQSFVLPKPIRLTDLRIN